MAAGAGRWQMHDKTTQAVRRNQERPLEGVQRLELLSWRFSEAEVMNLSLLQLLRRQRPNVLDLPVEASRLQFARWLVEHGRLSEDVPSGAVETFCADAAAEASPYTGGAATHGWSVSAGDRARDAEAEDTELEDLMDAEPQHPALRRIRSVARWCKSKAVACWREMTRPDYPYPPYGMGSWGTWGPYGVYDPYGPRTPWGSQHPITDSPWYWSPYPRD
jgi:hypothetical protein